MDREEGVNLKVRERFVIEKFDGDPAPGKQPVARTVLVYENGVLVERTDEELGGDGTDKRG